MNILIVDDSAAMRSTIKSVLETPGVNCIECSDGAFALDQYRDVQPAWVLMDVVMPGMNGFQATRNILAEYPDAKIVFVTNHDDKEYRDAARKCGASAYVLKENLLELRDLCTLNHG